jgi:uncharacterized protein
MKTQIAVLLLAAACVAYAATPNQPAVGTPAPGVNKAAGAQPGKIKEIEWIDLLPPDELDALMNNATIDHSKIFDPKSGDQGSFKVVAALDKQRLRIPGYIVPIDQDADGKLTEFFLVPFFGACIHVPPPPPNQIIYAKLKKPIEMTDIYTPFWAEGTLHTKRIENDLAASAYTLDVDKVEAYE